MNLFSLIFNIFNDNKNCEKKISNSDKFDLIKNRDFHLLFIGTCSS